MLLTTKTKETMKNFSNLNKTYHFLIAGNLVEVKKSHRTATQYEWFLTIYMGETKRFESILNYECLHLTKKSALSHAVYAILEGPQPRITKIA